MENPEEENRQSCRATDKADKMFVHIKTGSDGYPEQHLADNHISRFAQDNVKADNSEALPKLILTEISQNGAEPVHEGLRKDTEVHRVYC
ncbi:hypothetical protein KKHLCK_00305 [Candidatus Electrothrix laxa]